MTAAEPPSADGPTPPDPASRRIAELLTGLAPRGGHEIHAVFVLTVAAELASVVATDAEGRTVQILPPEEVLALVRRHREASAAQPGGPWWRYLLLVSASGEVRTDYDYGDEPFPDDHLFPAEVYRADLEVFPRDRLPVWLAAHIGHADRQSRPAETAAGAEPGAAVVEEGLPALPLLVARWAVLSAAFVAVGSPWGPRVLPALGLFEGAEHSGSSLWIVPGDRAVLSGGVWNDPVLDAVYNAGAPMPDLYAGAPIWVANPLLNPRAGIGLLSFCYWWDGGRWFRGASPPAAEVAAAVPAVWSGENTAAIVAALVEDQPGARAREAAFGLVLAAERGEIDRAALAEVFGAGDIEDAHLQLIMAGVASG
ncbi:hypothetical protein U3653_22500 [Nocardia sp. CDC186]|uniref:Uncharacterized protein n=1 Tax=Nocardia implantans TaxID=3108168 RepID=A0ABU6AZC9_9NOCA|nr:MULTISPECIES: hypothetical protein [unclassified Nocardia]MBF6194105.1 hypothetical protein [Nocardia beijingensis]MEA3529712.1 hypothetical protein [Nocardia sp. CDC192]MEB3512810.1 hypothetical protein [Nocardia sp. CDC186]